ncbi:MAG: dolichyl-phosphate-mannose--protein mannosyltransferase [bacterium]|nr:dolichyl-phosphate-mannose--protein mannosyltransferase [bacterium]
MSKFDENKFLKKASSYLWGENFNPWYLIFASIVIMLLMLGVKELWTGESRWANICQQMIIRHDYFHPYLDSTNYYDKPLLSYWLIIGCSYIFSFGRWALRFPGVISGLLTIWATYKIADHLSSRRAGIIAAWMMVSTYFFIFWSRQASADILNVAGIMLAVLWYLKKRDNRNFVFYFVFFLICALSALCKGLIAPVMIAIFLFPFEIPKNHWIKHLKWSMLIALIINIAIYAAPFIISRLTDASVHYDQSGLYEVFRENVVRYFNAFDHKGPIYTYLIYLPAYSAPWIVCTIPGLYYGIKKWKSIEWGTKYYIIALVLGLIFLSCSSSRRSYYVLPLVPYAILIGADWASNYLDKIKPLRNLLAGLILLALFVVLAADVMLAVGDMDGGNALLSKQIKTAAVKIQPWKNWNIIFFSTREKGSPRDVMFYLESPYLPKSIKLNIKGPVTKESYLKSFPANLEKDKNDILIVQQMYFKYLEPTLPKGKYTIIKSQRVYSDRWFNNNKTKQELTALIPKH